ncbi:hypothetical protein GZ77_22395 [Endozoicomonas montiporae]|uniref:Uncharacterized protein n=1 Tax=Endozoicomonas montiporae TaxID=1027273 RepID=A0A081N0A1_9GAMM|nr:hypothetical protein [Endozoicomonas montiporae]KEQ11874.1 hypothetical protein GZ77_22395 [Endozoicomonas montiporae]
MTRFCRLTNKASLAFFVFDRALIEFGSIAGLLHTGLVSLLSGIGCLRRFWFLLGDDQRILVYFAARC